MQTTPDWLEISSGVDRLAILRLSRNGLCRWYAQCCDTPMFNTLPKQALPFVGLCIHPWDALQADQRLGSVWGHAFTVSAPKGGGAPSKDVHFAGIGLGVIRRMLGALLSGRRKVTPLVAADGQWIAMVPVLTPEQRTAAQPDA